MRAEVNQQQIGKILNDLLKELPGKEGKKIVRKATRLAAREIILPQARNNAPVRSGALKRAIKVKAITRSRSAVGVRVTIGENDFQGDQFYGSFQELGWRSGKRSTDVMRTQKNLRKTIKNTEARAEALANNASDTRKQNPGKRFMKRAADTKADQATNRAALLIAEGIKDYWENG